MTILKIIGAKIFPFSIRLEDIKSITDERTEEEYVIIKKSKYEKLKQQAEKYKRRVGC